MAAQNPVVAHLHQQHRRARGMLSPWTRSLQGMNAGGEGAQRPSSPVDLRFKLAARKMRVLNLSRSGFVPRTASLANQVAHKFDSVRDLTHITLPTQQKESVWSKVEQVLPQTGPGEPQPSAESGVLRSGTVIPRMQTFPQPGQNIQDFLQQTSQSPAPKAPARPPEKPAVKRGDKLFTRVQEISPHTQTAPENTEPAIPAAPESAEPAAPATPPAIQRQVEPAPPPPPPVAPEAPRILAETAREAPSVQTPAEPAAQAPELPSPSTPVRRPDATLKAESPVDAAESHPAETPALPKAQPPAPAAPRLPVEAALPLAKPVRSKPAPPERPPKALPVRPVERPSAATPRTEPPIAQIPAAPSAVSKPSGAPVQREPLQPEAEPEPRPQPRPGIPAPQVTGSERPPEVAAAQPSQPPSGGAETPPAAPVSAQAPAPTPLHTAIQQRRRDARPAARLPAADLLRHKPAKPADLFKTGERPLLSPARFTLEQGQKAPTQQQPAMPAGQLDAAPGLPRAPFPGLPAGQSELPLRAPASAQPAPAYPPVTTPLARLPAAPFAPAAAKAEPAAAAQLAVPALPVQQHEPSRPDARTTTAPTGVVRRELDDLAGAARSAASQPDSSQAAADTGKVAATAGRPNLDQIAEDVMPYIKRLLSIESERFKGYL